MNILQVNKFFHICDGTSRYFFNVSQLLREKGHNISFFSMNHRQNIRSVDSKYFVSNISYTENIIPNALNIIKRMFYSIEAKDKIRKQLNEIKIDLVHIHSIYHHISPSILYEIKSKNIPIIMTAQDFHLLAPNYLFFHDGNICEITKAKKYYKALFHRCVKDSYFASAAEVFEKYFQDLFGWEKNLIDIFIVPTNFVKNKFIEYGFPEQKITVLNLFIKHDKYIPRYKPGEYILYFGGLYKHKGIFFLLDVMKYLPDLKCLIVGDGLEKNNLIKIIEREKIKNVKILGFKKESELINLIQESRFTVMPSIWYEGFGMVILEANACGKPVVASRIGGIPEVIENGVNGLLFEPGNIKDCTEKIKFLWNKAKTIEKFGRKARQKVETEFNQADHYQKLLKIYNLAFQKTAYS